MKKMKCYDCGQAFAAESVEELLNQMHPHYLNDHTEIISNANDEEKKAWMEKFNKDWEETPEMEG